MKKTMYSCLVLILLVVLIIIYSQYRKCSKPSQPDIINFYPSIEYYDGEEPNEPPVPDDTQKGVNIHSQNRVEFTILLDGKEKKFRKVEKKKC